MCAIKRPYSKNTLARLEKSAKKGARRSDTFAGVENRTTAFQERAERCGVIVILPAIKRREAKRLDLRVSKIEATTRH